MDGWDGMGWDGTGRKGWDGIGRDGMDGWIILIKVEFICPL